MHEVLTVYTSSYRVRSKSACLRLCVCYVILGVLHLQPLIVCLCACARACVCASPFSFFHKAVLFYIRLNESYATNHLRAVNECTPEL